MHIWAEDQQRPRHKRSAGEKLLKRVNLGVLVVQLGCLLIVISQASISAGKTYDMDLWFPRSFALHELIETKTRNCTLNVSTSIMFKNIPQTVSVLDREYRFAVLAARMRDTIVVNSINVAFSALNKVLFDLNFFGYKARHVVIRKEIFTVLELSFILFSLLTTLMFLPEAEVLREYLRSCGIDAQSSLPFTPSFAPIWVSLSLQTYVHIMSFVVLLRNSCVKTKPPREPQYPSIPQHLELPHEVAVDGTGDFASVNWRH